MNQKEIIELLKSTKESSTKRKFTQTYDLILNLKGIDFKKAQIDFFATIHFSKGKGVKVCGLVGPELKDEAQKALDEVVMMDDFLKYKDKKKAKKLAESFDFFVAQANIMTKVAATFGKIFGPRGKMPNPKVGCVVAPKTNLTPLYERLQKTVRIQVKKAPLIQLPVGNQNMKDEEIIDNIKTVYDQVIHHLPNEKNNIKDIYLKTTMGKPVKLGGEKVETEVKPKATQTVKESDKATEESNKETIETAKDAPAEAGD